MQTWSEPYHGVTHLSAAGKKSYATVEAFASFARATFNAFPIRGSSVVKEFPSLAEAKAACEAWIETTPV